MKTLLIYHTNKAAVRAMCEATAAEDVDVLELRPRYKKRPVIDSVADMYRAFMGRGIRLAPLDIDFAKYDGIVMVDSLRAMSPSAECNEFLYRCDLGGRDISCIVSNRMRWFGRAGRLLRKRIRLAGGTCRGITYLAETDLSKQTMPATAFELVKE
ncbi:MAG: hypothetical protein LBG83_00190 [Oscillospiraceae bacterium]|jgi:hypothetical protein|nr:hypothetical protein [Oscillospiraceae bacterium]